MNNQMQYGTAATKRAAARYPTKRFQKNKIFVTAQVDRLKAEVNQ